MRGVPLTVTFSERSARTVAFVGSIRPTSRAACLLAGLRHGDLPLGGVALLAQPGWAPAFAARLKDAVNLDAVRDDLTGTVQQALEPAHLSVWVSPGR